MNAIALEQFNNDMDIIEIDSNNNSTSNNESSSVQFKDPIGNYFFYKNKYYQI